MGVEGREDIRALKHMREGWVTDVVEERSVCDEARILVGDAPRV